MELIEMIGGVGLGFVPTLIFGNGLLARFIRENLTKHLLSMGLGKFVYLDDSI